MCEFAPPFFLLLFRDLLFRDLLFHDLSFHDGVFCSAKFHASVAREPARLGMPA